MNHETETVSEKTKTAEVEVTSKPTVATVAKELAELKAKLNEILGLEI